MNNNITNDPVQVKIDLFLTEHAQKPKSEADILAFLAGLDPVTFDRSRDRLKEGLEIRLGTLDELFKKSRPAGADTLSGTGLSFPEIKPLDEVVDGAALLDEIHDLLTKHVVLPAHGYVIAALWTLFSWSFDLFDVCPILFLTSPEKRCGKTTLLSLLSKLTARPLPASNISPPAVFRVIEKVHPTLLIDEADSFLRENEELRGVINSGHTRGAAYVVRTVGEDFEPRSFSTWAPKVLAGIGKLPDTLEDRSIRLDLKRKTKDEKVFRVTRETDEQCQEIVRKIARWVQDHTEDFRTVAPILPEISNDRSFDNWYPLGVIATVAGRHWPERVMEAVWELEGSGDDVENAPLSIELLKALKGIFETEGEKVSSATIVEYLNFDDEGPWKGFSHGRGIDARSLSRMLKPFGIRSKNVNIHGVILKGYERPDFEDVFVRYLPQKTSFSPGEGDFIRYSATFQSGSHSPGKNPPLPKEKIADEKSAQMPNCSEDSGIADKGGGPGEEKGFPIKGTVDQFGRKGGHS